MKQINFDVVGGNADSYTGKGNMWDIAKRYNDKSRAMNGEVTCARRRSVKKVSRVGVL